MGSAGYSQQDHLLRAHALADPPAALENAEQVDIEAVGDVRLSRAGRVWASVLLVVASGLLVPGFFVVRPASAPTGADALKAEAKFSQPLYPPAAAAPTLPAAAAAAPPAAPVPLAAVAVPATAPAWPAAPVDAAPAAAAAAGAALGGVAPSALAAPATPGAPPAVAAGAAPATGAPAALGGTWPAAPGGAGPFAPGSAGPPAAAAATTPAPPTSTLTAAATVSPNPTLLCFLVSRSWGDELEMVRAQAAQRAGIFACSASAVVSDARLSLGAPCQTYAIGDLKANPVPWGVANTWVFVKAWDAIIAADVWRRHDWTVKVDPDAVLFPDRLLQHLSKIPKNVLLDHSGGAWGHRGLFIKNCQVGLTLRGALEVISRSGVETYMKHTHECQAKNNPDGSGEDGFMHDCWSMIGVGKVFLPDLLRDQYCAGGSQAPSCNDGWAAAFHPMKHTWNWNNCFHIAAASR